MKAIYLSFFICISFIANGQKTNEFKGENWIISNGQIKPKGNSKDAKAIDYWNYLSDILPDDLLNKYVTGLSLFSDGIEEDAGGITPINNINTKWVIDLDTIDFKLKSRNKLHIINYNHTIIHEFGHLLTLNPEQVTITNDVIQDDNKGYLTIEGYASNKSYLGKFVKQFWNEDLLEEWDNIDKLRSEKRKVKLLYKFYLRYQDMFLTDYAAESPEEDIAEAWTFFVLSEKPKSNKVKHRKILFFYNFPELIKYREQIRKNLQLIPDDYVNSFQLTQ